MTDNMLIDFALNVLAPIALVSLGMLFWQIVFGFVGPWKNGRNK